jgi:aminopeptidase
MKIKDFDQILKKYADLTIKVGLNLQPDQRLFIWVQQLEVAPLVRQVVRSAYQNGCRRVSVLWNDDQEIVDRLQLAPKDTLEEFDIWKTRARFQAADRKDASLIIRGRDPDVFADLDPEDLATYDRVYMQNMKPYLNLAMRNATQWCVVNPPTPDWASTVFPDLAPEKAEKKMWEYVIKACRLDQPDPVDFWNSYLDGIKTRAASLNQKRFQALKFRGSGTDIKVGLPKGHIWIGGKEETPEGIPFAANLPTEEIFTIPHRLMTEGVVSATKPLVYLGNQIENFQLVFSKGKVVEFQAEKGEDTLRFLLESDDNSKYLGEVALVAHKTPISQMGLTFLNTLYDENASNHLALGSSYRNNLQGGENMSDEEYAQAGGNDSINHVDFMFGSEEMDVDGVLPDGTEEAVMRGGEWAFDL